MTRQSTVMKDTAGHHPGKGIFWMAVTGILFIGVATLVKYLGTRIPSTEAAFLRYLLGLVFLLPMLKALRNLKLEKWLLGLFVARGMSHTVAVACWFFAMTNIPLADVTAMNYLTPVFVTIGAVLFFGERLALRRMSAVIVAIIGVLIILRPGFREIGAGHFAMIITAVAFSGSFLMAKKLSHRCSAGLVVAMLSITVTIGIAPFAMANWITPTWNELLILFGVASFATGGHYTMILAFRNAPLTVTQPVTFLQLVWAVLIGMIIFREPLDPYVIAGGLVILGAVSYSSWRETFLKKKTFTSPSTGL
ncbi:MAG: DMT family transporter [Roseovarius sp.]|nr:DMT family transporter [Roseovarius sp.]